MKPIIEINNLSKKYRIGVRQPYYSLRDALMGVMKNPFAGFKMHKTYINGLAEDEFWAVKEITLKIMPGEVIGIIGRNGAGKSTLLKLLSQITPPTKGEIILRGRIASLLEVGTGFHPELTGRENIFLNGAILGMKQKEIKKRFDQIVDFAEIDKFLDTPVKHYSSGMYMRLAFAVAAHLDSEILLIDEVLAVGDIQFQNKCLNKIQSVTKSGRTVIFISHNLSVISRFTNTCFLFENGQIVKTGEPKKVIDYFIQKDITQDGDIEYKIETQKKAQILKVSVLDKQNNLCRFFHPSKDIIVDVDFIIRDKNFGQLSIYIAITLTDGTIIWNWDSKDHLDVAKKISNDTYRIRAVFPGEILTTGQYTVRAAINLNGKAYHNHPNFGSGVGIEISEGGNIKLFTHKWSGDGIIAVKPEYQIEKI